VALGTGSDLKILAILLIAAALSVLVLFTVGQPLVAQFVAALEPGVGLKEAAKWSFGTTVVLFVLFALVAGDGILGELQFMLLGFFAFFVIIGLLIAWVF
jgi:hypothetical protein